MRVDRVPRSGLMASDFKSSGVALNRRSLVSADLVAIAIMFASAMFGSAHAEYLDDPGDWVGTWGASPQWPVNALGSAPSFTNQTVREIVQISVGGGRFRVRLTNEFGTQPLLIGAAHIAISAGGAAIESGTDRVLTFGGQPSILVPPGAPALSDPVDLPAAHLAHLAISIYLPQTTGPATWHLDGNQTAYIVLGDATSASDLGAGATTSIARFFLSSIEAASSDCKSVVVTLGDSITDGTGSTIDTNQRWPDFLAERLITPSGLTDTGVVNEGIAGNRILHTDVGPNALSRFDRDVLATPGVRFVTVLLGINDIGLGGSIPTEAVTADDIIGGYRQLIARAHSHSILIYGATLTPFDNFGSPYFSAANEAERQQVNAWIRASGEFDAVIDFDEVVRDPNNPSKLLPAFDSGDHLHPNNAGYRAMANSIDRELFKLGDDISAGCN
jgi:lysophospholipase L1-like esterase